MPAIKSLSEFTRNQNAMIDALAKSREPIYLTRNGDACVVVMDAEAFDEAMEFRNDLYLSEMEVYKSILRGYQEFERGEFVEAGEADAELRAAKGWS